MKLFYTFIILLVVMTTGLLASSATSKMTITQDEFDAMSAEDVIKFVNKNGNVSVVPNKGMSGLSVSGAKSLPVVSGIQPEVVEPCTTEVDQAKLNCLKGTNDFLKKELADLEQEVEESKRLRREKMMVLALLQEDINSVEEDIVLSQDLLDKNSTTVPTDGVVKDNTLVPPVVKDVAQNNYQTNTIGQPEIKTVTLSRDVVTIYDRGRNTNIVSSGSPYSVVIVGDRPEQDGLINGQEPVGNLLPHQAEEGEFVADSQDQGNLIVGVIEDSQPIN